jgi:outer membrane biosynthesis protein TonB
MLRDVRNAKAPPVQPPPPPTPQPSRGPTALNDPARPLSKPEEDAIRQRIVQNWYVDVGAKGIETFEVVLRVFVAADGTVLDVRVEQTRGSPSEALKAFADGAARAARRSSPLPLPQARVTNLINGNLVLSFTPKDMLGLR